jgi:hypothetical protein
VSEECRRRLLNTALAGLQSIRLASAFACVQRLGTQSRPGSTPSPSLFQLQRRLALRPDQRPEEAFPRWLLRRLRRPHSAGPPHRRLCGRRHLPNDGRAWPRQPCLRVHGGGWPASSQPLGLRPQQPSEG